MGAINIGDIFGKMGNRTKTRRLTVEASHELLIAEQRAGQANERLGVFAHELRKHLNTATLALTEIRSSTAGMAGISGANDADGGPPARRRD